MDDAMLDGVSHDLLSHIPASEPDVAKCRHD
jgi:hypothetical protein